MLRRDYFKYALRNGLPGNKDWVIGCFTVLTDGYRNEYVKMEDGEIYALVDHKMELLDDVDENEAICPISDNVDLTKTDIVNIPKVVATTYGRALVNYLLIARPFKEVIPYINDMITPAVIEDKLLPHLGKEIEVSQYYTYLQAVLFLENLSTYLSSGNNEHSVLPPPNIGKLRKEIAAKYRKEYGADCFEDPIIMGKYTTELKEIEDAYVKEDKTSSIILNKKAKNSRKQLHAIFTPGEIMGDDTVPVLEPLSKGMPIGNTEDEKKQIAMTYSASRQASYSRGNETGLGGVAMKILMRPAMGVVVVDGDCGSTAGILTMFSKEDIKYYVGRYVLRNGKPIEITADNVDGFMYKVIEIRSPIKCKQKDGYCSTCCGMNMSRFKNDIPITISKIGGSMLRLSLAKFHSSSIGVVTIKDDAIV